MGTKWSSYSDIDLYKSFTSQVWDNWPVEDRRELLQEVENREAALRGATPRELKFEDLEGRTLGYQLGDTIVINDNLVSKGVLRVEYENKSTGQIKEREISYPASNWHLLDTVFHEATHGQQEDENRGQTMRSYIDGEGDGQNPNDMDYLLYRLGVDEMEAFNNGQLKTLGAIDYVLEYGNLEKIDPTMKIYMESQQGDTVDVYVNQAKELFKDEDVVEHIKAWTDDMENEQNHSETYNITKVLDQEIQAQNLRRYQDFLNRIEVNCLLGPDGGAVNGTDSPTVLLGESQTGTHGGQETQEDGYSETELSTEAQTSVAVNEGTEPDTGYFNPFSNFGSETESQTNSQEAYFSPFNENEVTTAENQSVTFNPFEGTDEDNSEDESEGESEDQAHVIGQKVLKPTSGGFKRR